MTGLLSSPSTSRPARPGAADGPTRPLAVGAALAGAVAAGSVLVACMALALAGWFASDGGGHGDTRDALRVGADAWLLAHGSSLHLSAATVSLVPLGLTWLCGYVAYRLGRWAGLTCAVDDLRTLLTGTAVLAGVYGVVAILTAVLASLEQAQPHLGRAFLGGFVLAFLAGGLGILAGSGHAPAWWDRLPGAVLAAGTVALSAVLLLLTASSLLVTGSLLADFGDAATVLSRLHVDAAGGALATAVVAALVPNAVLLGGGYLLGPGFAVGAGTLVSPSAVVLGPVPAFPLLAALPDDTATPWWTAALPVVPGLVGLAAAMLAARRFPVRRYDVAAGRGLAGGMLGAVLFTGLLALAGGSAGPGRMADVGGFVLETLTASLVSLGAGGLVGAVLATWWQRRRDGRVERSTAEPAAD